MATFDLNISGGTAPYTVSVKKQGDVTERFVSMTGNSVTFTGGSGNNTYDVVVSKVGCNTGTTTFSLGCNTPTACTTYNIQGTTAGATYSYDDCTTLNTVTGTLNSGQSIQVCAETGTASGTGVTVTSITSCQPSCTFPTGLSLVKDSQTSTTVTIQVLATDGATFKHCLGVNYTCGDANCLVGDGNINGTFTINLATGASASYTVRVYSRSGCACYSDITRTITNDFPTACTGIVGCTIN